MSTPFATWVFGGMGALFLLRGLWNPHRALAHSGALRSCPGPEAGGCQNTIALQSDPGTRIYSAASGDVLAVGDRWVLVQVSNEPVVIGYYGVTPDVVQGQHVGRGRNIGESDPNGLVEFGVTQMEPGGLVALEPRSWLASRGITLTVKRMPETDQWCGPARHITVPVSVHQGCGLQNPQEAGFALLPVSVTQA